MDTSNFLLHLLNLVLQPLLKWTADGWEHDRKIFASLDSILDEDQLLELITNLQSGDCFYLSQALPIENFIRNSEKSGLSFIRNNLNRKLSKFVLKLCRFREFVSDHFYASRSEQQPDLMVLEPNLNLDRSIRIPSEEQQRQYKEYSGQLWMLAKDVENAYRDFRKAI